MIEETLLAENYVGHLCDATVPLEPCMPKDASRAKDRVDGAMLRLERELATLDKMDAVILDDIGYVQQNCDEMEVLFTFLAGAVQTAHGNHYEQPRVQ